MFATFLPLLLAQVMTPQPEAAAPLRLEARPSAQGVELTVVGQSETPLSASYKLAVTAGSNRSQQSGNVELRPGAPVTMVRLNLGGGEGTTWDAHLEVTLADGRVYSDRQSSR